MSLPQGRDVRVVLTPAAESAHFARAVVEFVLDALVDRDVIDTVMLLASELVTNAVLHASPPVRVRVEITAAVLHVEIHDSGTSALPAPSTAGATETSGRGLAIVEALASRWGSQPTEGGKFVWFELPSR